MVQVNLAHYVQQVYTLLVASAKISSTASPARRNSHGIKVTFVTVVPQAHGAAMHTAAGQMNPSTFAAAIATASANAAATGGTALASVPSASDMSVSAPGAPQSTTLIISVLVVAGVGLAVYFGVFSSGSPPASSGMDTSKPPAPTSAGVSTVGASGTGRSCC